MLFDENRVRTNAQQAETEDLLDRITTFREAMDPRAIPILEDELWARGVTPQQIEAHARQRQETGGVLKVEGVAVRCSRCSRPAVEQSWGWHRLWGVLPLFPRRLFSCEVHRSGTLGPRRDEPGRESREPD